MRIVQHVAQGESADQALLEFVEVAGLGQILVAGADGSQDGFAIRLSGKNDADGARKFGLDQVEQFGAIHAGHAHVGDHDVEGGESHGLQSFRPAVGEFDFPLGPHGAQAALNALQHQRLVIDE